MKSIVFCFHKSDTLLSRSIRFVSGEYSHVSIHMEIGVYEAHIKHGVTYTKHNQYHADDIADMIIVPVTQAQYNRTLKFIKKQVGKKYDILGVLSFLWFFIKPKIGKWYCSELAMVALMKALGVSHTDYDQKQSPFSFYLTTKMIMNI